MGLEEEIVTARNGRPVARLFAIAPAANGPRIRIAKGKFEALGDINEGDAEIAELFLREAT